MTKAQDLTHVGCFLYITLLSFSPSSSQMYSLFVGDLTPEVDDGMLYEFFYNRYPSCRGGKVVLDSMGNSK